MQDITHLLFALALVYVIGLPIIYGVIGGVFPDADLWIAEILPVAHRGIMHTPIFVVVATAVLYVVTDRRDVAAAFGLGMGSHLLLDSITPMGVMWLYPALSTRFTLDIVLAANPVANLAMSTFFVAVMVGWRYQHLLDLDQRVKRAAAVLLLVMVPIGIGAATAGM